MGAALHAVAGQRDPVLPALTGRLSSAGSSATLGRLRRWNIMGSNVMLARLDHLRMVTTVGRPDAAEYTFASFLVESGRPGALPV